MIKGWRNDPQWVTLHRQIEAEKYQRRLENMRAQYRSDEAERELKYSTHMLNGRMVSIKEK